MKDDKTARTLRALYDISRHHAWAGTVLLSVILAIRIFLEMADIKYLSDTIFTFIGTILTGYILTALFFTYRYRKALYYHDVGNQKNNGKTIQNTSSKEREKIAKNMYKMEKKKSKNEGKSARKASKK
ncbi:MAG: hypothetical protein KKC68_07955 [Candidatus Thermoplasmatota archaeon]|nr:hypothetical protein [Candidatus Thermoplasmatota archaeon]MBU1941691.1 hypothetical protein [Candidatus Thermoplasmatota archaeon]